MIIARLMGGIGNQMFQYAFGRRLADGLGVELRLDTAAYRRDAKRSFMLDQWRADAVPASAAEVAALGGDRVQDDAGPLRSRLARLQGDPPAVVRERGFAFDPALIAVRDGSYVVGYWQSERYFAPAAERLRGEFVPRRELSPAAAALAGEMAAGESVSVHVRRGDYVHERRTARVHGVCDEAYYARCFRLLEERLAAPRLYIFSDEPAWVREHFAAPFPKVVVSSGGPGLEASELWLMSRCRHHVIANSSFSWWGAWLGRDPAGLVLLPRHWFRKDGDVDGPACAGIRPEGWTAV